MHGQVLHTRHLAPNLVRVVLGGGDLDAFAMVEATDAYVNLAFAPPGAPYGPVFVPAEVRAAVAREHWPVRRRFTVRSWDEARKELTLDFVVHGDSGFAGSWAARARVGDVLVLEGPAGGYRPDPEADWLLMVGDESALPAIAASLEVVPPGTPVVVRLLCDGPEHEIDLESPGDVSLGWVHRRADPGNGDLLLAAVANLSFPAGRVQGFVHGEATEIRGIRRHLLAERGLTRADMSCSPYWRRDMTDEAWREVKRDFVAAMEADVEVPHASGVAG